METTEYHEKRQKKEEKIEKVIKKLPFNFLLANQIIVGSK